MEAMTIDKDNQTNPFEMSREEMKNLGYRVVDMIVDHFETLDEKKPVARASREEMPIEICNVPSGI